MKYAIDKQFGLWRHMKQPVMGERFFRLFFRLAERIVKTDKYFLSHKDVNVDTITVQTLDNYPINSYLITPNKLKSNGIILYLHGLASAPLSWKVPVSFPGNSRQRICLQYMRLQFDSWVGKIR